MLFDFSSYQYYSSAVDTMQHISFKILNFFINNCSVIVITSYLTINHTVNECTGLLLFQEGA
jgi:hypothetical protein